MLKPENVWDYPRPPALEPANVALFVALGGREIARTEAALRVLETSHPPTYYLPRNAFADGVLTEARGTSLCEWKGWAAYFDVRGGGEVRPRAAWHYPEPTRGFADILGHVALYPGRMDAVWVDGERARAQEGDLYGGWITSNLEGPFKGAPGTRGW